MDAIESRVVEYGNKGLHIFYDIEDAILEWECSFCSVCQYWGWDDGFVEFDKAGWVVLVSKFSIEVSIRLTC